MRTRLLLAALVTLLASWPLHSQSAPQTPQTQSSTRVSGRVIDPEGRPLRGVRVQVVAPPATFDAVYTDEAGEYASAAPSNTPFAIQVFKAGYVARQPDAATNDPSLPIQLMRGAAITGRVVDRFGDAGVGFGVQVRLVDGGATARNYATIADDLGEFRIGSLPPGRYAARVTRGVVHFDEKTAALTIPLIESYESTTMPQEFTVAAGQEVSVNLVHDAGNDPVERGAIAAGNFERDQIRSRGRREVSSNVGTVEGWVGDDRGRLARGVVVQLEPLGTPADPLTFVLGSSTTRRSSSDADGRYVFTGVPAGRYAVFARRTEYGSSGAGISHGAAQAIEVRANETLSVPLSIARSSAVGGTVVDRYGDPVEGAVVDLHRVRFAQGRAVLERLRDFTVRVTDDRGHYRIPDVPPGRYFVVVQRDGLETYYPGRASLAEATGVRIDPGTDAPNMHVMLQDAPRARVFGVVNGANRNLEVVLSESVRASAVARRRVARLKGTEFEYRNIPPGDYVLQAIERGTEIDSAAALLEARVAAFGTQYISVSSDAVGPVVVNISPTGSISGRIRLEASGGETLTQPVLLAILSSDPDRAPTGSPLTDVSRGGKPFPLAQANRNGAFAIEGVVAPFRLTALLPNTRWWLKAANIDGVNAVLDPVAVSAGRSVSDVEVVLSGDAATIEGRITDARVAESGASVIAFSAESRRWFHGSQFVRKARASRDGAFAIAGLPPGDYHLVAVDDLPEDEALTDLTGTDFLLDLVPRARRISLTSSERAKLELPLRSSR